MINSKKRSIGDGPKVDNMGLNKEVLMESHDVNVVYRGCDGPKNSTDPKKRIWASTQRGARLSL